MALTGNIARELKAYAEKDQNVLLEGLHGTGKSALVMQVFDEVFGPGNWAYIAGATIDPYVDFVGLPYAKKLPDGTETLGFLRPEMWDHNIQALFIDELNRAQPKVVNAAMELIQFKKVNGMATGVRVVWGAINPDSAKDDIGQQRYQVNALDPAHIDRFQIHITIPNQPDLAVFRSMFGPEKAKAVLDYWNALDAKVRNEFQLSPRRLEYAVRAHAMNLPIKHVINEKLKPSDLEERLSAVSVGDQFRSLIASGNADGLKQMINGKECNAVWSLAETPEEIQTILTYVSPDRVGTLVQNAKFHVKVDDKDRRNELIDILSTTSYKESEAEKVADWIDKNDVAMIPAPAMIKDVEKNVFDSKIFSKSFTNEEEAIQLMLAAETAFKVAANRAGVGLMHEELILCCVALNDVFTAHPKLAVKRQVQSFLGEVREALKMRSPDTKFTGAFEAGSLKDFHTKFSRKPQSLITVLQNRP